MMTKTDVEDAKKISEIFKSITDESKNMAIGYLSALKDKETADRCRRLQETG